jgi:hypothetical protein
MAFPGPGSPQIGPHLWGVDPDSGTWESTDSIYETVAACGTTLAGERSEVFASTKPQVFLGVSFLCQRAFSFFPHQALKGHGFTGFGKLSQTDETRQGTTLVVPQNNNKINGL